MITYVHLFAADDMGLGKTLTMIALILAQKQLKTEKRKETLEIWLSKNGTEFFPFYSTYIVMKCHLKCLKHYRLRGCRATHCICAHIPSAGSFHLAKLYCASLHGLSLIRVIFVSHWMRRIFKLNTLDCLEIFFY